MEKIAIAGLAHSSSLFPQVQYVIAACLRHYFNWSDADLLKMNDLSSFYYFISTSLLHLLPVIKVETRRPASVLRMRRTGAFCKSC